MIADTLRLCACCGTPEPISGYWRSVNRKDKTDTVCKKCRNAQYKNRYYAKKIVKVSLARSAGDVLRHIDRLLTTGRIKDALNAVHLAMASAGNIYQWTKKMRPNERDNICDDYKCKLQILRLAIEQIMERAKNENA